MLSVCLLFVERAHKLSKCACSSKCALRDVLRFGLTERMVLQPAIKRDQQQQQQQSLSSVGLSEKASRRHAAGAAG